MNKFKTEQPWAVHTSDNVVALDQLARAIESEGVSLRRAVERRDEIEAVAVRRRLEHLTAAINLLLPPGEAY